MNKDQSPAGDGTSLQLLVSAADRLLHPEQFDDYCPNGLQVQGRNRVKRLISGVTASLAFIEAAIAAGGDALLVHHGCLWRADPLPLTGMKGRRIRAMMMADISLLAYHLPLDAHPELGNNATLAKCLDIEITGPLEPDNAQNIGLVGRFAQPVPAGQLVRRIENKLGRQAFHIGAPEALIHSIAWCSGGAQSYFRHAIARGTDAFLTGEISEQNTHEARETGIHYIAAGHHATECGGVRATGQYLASELGIEHQFVEIANPA